MMDLASCTSQLIANSLPWRWMHTAILQLTLTVPSSRMSINVREIAISNNYTKELHHKTE